jgi:hypothetical protein
MNISNAKRREENENMVNYRLLQRAWAWTGESGSGKG